MPDGKAVECFEVPDRYMQDGIETIDRIRMELNELGGPVLGDCAFIGFCLGNYRKYMDRHAFIGVERDLEKAKFYAEMAQHLMGNAEDPRHRRPGFVSMWAKK